MFPNRGSRLNDQIAQVYEQKRMFAEAFAAQQQMLSIDKCSCVTALAEAYKRAGYRALGAAVDILARV